MFTTPQGKVFQIAILLASWMFTSPQDPLFDLYTFRQLSSSIFNVYYTSRTPMYWHLQLGILQYIFISFKLVLHVKKTVIQHQGCVLILHIDLTVNAMRYSMYFSITEATLQTPISVLSFVHLSCCSGRKYPITAFFEHPQRHCFHLSSIFNF